LHKPLKQVKKGFSLIELLITVAIIAALVGIAVPFFTDFINEANDAKVSADIDVLKDAIHRYESGGHKFGGVTFAPLMGKFLQEVPKDPWGNEYLVDTNLGLIATLGADSAYGGEEADSDILVYYSPSLQPIRALYTGAFGVPKNGFVLEVIMSKSITFVPDSNLEDWAADDILVYKDIASVPVPLSAFGFKLNRDRTNELDGWLVFVCTDDTINTENLTIRSHDLINISALTMSFTETPIINGPFFDSGSYLRLGPEPSSLQAGGVKIERSQ
jgi:prepilin-type N-terminal cleavage/methylation domain-containing protein